MNFMIFILHFLPQFHFQLKIKIIISNSQDCIDYIFKHLEVHQKYYNLLSVCKCGQTRPPVFDTSPKSEKCVMLTIRSGHTEVRKLSCIIKSTTQSHRKKKSMFSQEQSTSELKHTLSYRRLPKHYTSYTAVHHHDMNETNDIIMT